MTGSIKIHAAVLREPGGSLNIERVRLDAPRPDEVIVRVVGVGICHTDLTVMGRLTNLPFVLGHEGSGIVEAVGKGVTRVAPGDHVVMSFSACRTCAACDDGEPSYCDHFAPMNFGGRRRDGSATIRDLDGGDVNACFFGQSSFATHALAREQDVVKVRRDVPLELLGPLGCGFQTGAGTVMNIIKPGQDHALAVFGVGAVGCAAVMAAKHMGCARIIAIDRAPARLDFARSLGATDTIDTATTDLSTALARLGGLDSAVETTGSPAVMEAAFTALKPRGILACHAVSGEARLNLDVRALLGGKTVTGVCEGGADPQSFIPELIELYRAGRFPLERLISFYRFDEMGRAIEDALAGSAIKPVLTFDGQPVSGA